MLMTTVVAVALGFAPVKQDGTVQAAPDNYASIVGRISENKDRDGKRHLRGFNRLDGDSYDLAIDGVGRVEGRVGNSYVAFQIRQA
jgi:hypothetical protein